MLMPNTHPLLIHFISLMIHLLYLLMIIFYPALMHNNEIKPASCFILSFLNQLLYYLYCNRYGVEPFLSAVCQQSSRNQVNHRPKNADGWRAGIANCKYSYLCHLKRRTNGTILNYTLAILRLLFYIYCFIFSLSPLALSSYVLQNLSQIPALSFYCPTFQKKNGTILSNCLLINFASLTLHAQPLINFILTVIKDFFTSVRSQLCYFFTKRY